MYEASAPRFANILGNLGAILDKAQMHCDARKIDPLALTGFRLYPDMFPFSRQVQIACDTAKCAVARLAGMEIPKYEDSERTFAELKARIAKTRDFVASVPAARIDGAEAREIVLPMRSGERRFTGLQYLLGHALPNFYFHVTTAYNILRHNGVEIGKQDYLGTP